MPICTRGRLGQWLLTSFGGLEDIIVIESLGCSLKLADIYEKVEFGGKLE